MGRMLAARSYVRMERQQRGEAELQHRAAVVIQCNARSFMTRLIYLDVLYLICRIQAAMRGCLVRKQLRWIRASDVEGISKLQAHVRGYLVRRRIAFVQESIESDINLSVPASNLSNHEDVGKADQATQADFGTSVPRLGETSNHANGGYRSTRASSFSFKSDGKNGRNNLAKSLTGLGWQPSVEPAIKRSYWLPAGDSFDRRLPVLPVPKRMLALERVCADSGDPLGGDEQRLINQSWTPKKRPHQKPCPVRLSPVVIPSVRPEVPEINLNEDAVNENANLFEKEERIRRQEELKQKLQSRRNQEKRQQKLELKLKGEAELKILRRRSKEGKIRQVSADQRREERERIAMTREERHIRLHIKFCSRQVSKKRQQLATASTTASESESQPSSTKQTRRDSSIAKARKTTSRSKREDGASSDDDGDMSFLDIDFTIPAAMKPRNQAGSNTGNSQTKKPRGSSKHTLTKKQKRAPGRGKCNRDNTCEAVPLSVQEDQEDDCGYGDEFDDVEDEVALGSLIC
ncbi:unnamed protein product [Phytophthora lilii]|uniref:Unnamed protein product n=1 Tax=Phytophthora lilii TaxID=2077276 RepID=A0A9W6TIN8_9STRA|nr:unnamed protein product [Phytophthora lilii]